MPREKLMNVEEFEKALDRNRLDAVVASSMPNVFYTSGALIFTQVEIPDRLAFTVLPRARDDVLVVCNLEESLSREETWIEDVRSYVEFAESPISLLTDVLKEKGLSAGRIGIEKRRLAATYYEELAEALPQAKLEPCDGLFTAVRSIKIDGEIERFSQAALATERAIVDAFREARAGQTERHLLKLIVDNVWRLGASRVGFSVLGVGDQSWHAHPSARDREMEEGDLIRVDFGASFSGYGSDVARTAVVGRASQEQLDTYSKHRQVQREAIELMRPGVRACDVFEHCLNAYDDLGLQLTIPHVGHGCGLEVHETPMLQPRNTQELRPNMLICIEPVLLSKELGGYAVEDLVLIKEEGSAEILTNYADTEEIFVIQ
jgi:Xaa-Pro aminopeptidase